MKFLPLVWAMLWRSRARTWLTFLSIVVAFLLFGLLHSVGQIFELGSRLAGEDRLIVTYRQGLTQLLPIAYRGRIEAIEGVRAVAPTMWLGGTYQDPKNPVQMVAIDPANVREMDPRVLLPDDQARAFASTRTGAVAGRELAETYGWKVGDRVPITAAGMPRKDGGEVWTVDLVGIYELDRRQTGRPVPAQLLLIDYEYYNQAAVYSSLVVWYTVRVQDARQAPAIAKAIDAEFRNSTLETRTQSEAEFQRGLVRRFGNIDKMIATILAAVFFTLALVAGNTMMQAFRERIAELAVLKTLGFSNARVAALVGAESLLLCLFGGAVGLAVTVGLVTGLAPLFAGDQILGAMYVERNTLLAGLALALGLGALSALAPVWRSARLTVVEGLRTS